MATSNIKLFNENKQNMTPDADYNTDSQRLNGVQAGIASSQIQNKSMYQTSLVAYAIARLMYDNGVNANDTDSVATFIANLKTAIGAQASSAITPAAIGALAKAGDKATGPISFRDYTTVSTSDGGNSLFGQNCYITSDGKYKYSNTHASMGARGLVINWGTLKVYYFDKGNIATTKDAEFTVSLKALYHEGNKPTVADIANATPKSSTTTTALYASTWSMGQYQFNDNAITATNVVELIPAVGITLEQLAALQAANIVGGPQANGYIYLYCMGEVPAIDIPVTFVFRGDT